MDLPITFERDELASFCRRNHVVRLAFFGSVLTRHFGPESDVDVLVEFDPEHTPGLLAVARMEEELSAILGRKADIRTPRDLSRYFRDDVLRNAMTQYAT